MQEGAWRCQRGLWMRRKLIACPESKGVFVCLGGREGVAMVGGDIWKDEK